jgi:hypothetical protein
MRRPLHFAFACLLAACSGDSPTGSDVLGGSLTVEGDVVDFQSGAVLTSAASVSTTALMPLPTITANGAHFVIDGVPENSAFQILASAAPTHRPTYSPAVEVISDDRDGVKAFAVSEQFMTSLASGFGVTPSAAKGVLLIHLVDAAGTAKAGVAANTIVLANAAGAVGPKFLDANLAPAGTAVASSASGWAVFFEVPPGVVTFSGTGAVMPSSPIGAGAVTIADAQVSDGPAPQMPTNVSFTTQVFPIFSARGCVACHSGGGPGKDLGGLMLDGGANLAYKELTMENPLRVQKATPEKSLLLTMPSAESPSDGHPNVTFTGPQDPDYLKILVWIREGAKLN